MQKIIQGKYPKKDAILSNSSAEVVRLIRNEVRNLKCDAWINCGRQCDVIGNVKNHYYERLYYFNRQ